jgi:hypothetical protein
MVTHSSTGAAEAERIIALWDGEVLSPGVDVGTPDLDVSATSRANSAALTAGRDR